MIVIHGEANSGKSYKALRLLNKDQKSLYFALDFDKRIKSLELTNKKIQVTAFPRGTYLSDIEFEILNNGGLYQNSLSCVIIDPINFIKDEISTTELILKLQKLETDYNKFKLILVINTLYHFELSKDIKKLKNIEFIESKRRKLIKV